MTPRPHTKNMPAAPLGLKGADSEVKDWAGAVVEEAVEEWGCSSLAAFPRYPQPSPRV